MAFIGEYLRDIRNELGYSMETVKDKTGITDSRLSRIENGDTCNPPALVLKQLAEFYNLDLIDLFLLAGYLSQDQIECHQHDFSGMEMLNSEEKLHIQQQIDFLLKHKVQKEARK